jgi:tetratricopeptide (TPR) repeat protein
MTFTQKSKENLKRHRRLRVATFIILFAFFASSMILGGISIYSSINAKSPSRDLSNANQDSAKANLERWEKAEKAAPNDPFVLRNLAQALEMEGKNQEARQFLQKAIRLSPNDYLNEKLLGELDFLDMDFEGAAKAFQEALLLKPFDQDLEKELEMAEYLLGESLKKKGDRKQAKEWLEKALALAKELHDKTLQDKIQASVKNL